jgi:ubiquinone/menaquinone biosynthesis C-methylase UbiE
LRYLTHQQARRFYDRFGAKQDTQSFYEDKAIKALLQHADFQHARAVLEFGCGTGSFAEKLLLNVLPGNATYYGVDISSTMVGLASQRLQVYTSRARVTQSEGETRLAFPEKSFDRFISAYVLDLLPGEEISELLNEAHRVLTNNGMLALASLSHGESVLSKTVTGMWSAIHRVNPNWVGGCRPVELRGFINPSQWKITYCEKISQFGITSEVLVAEKTTANLI